MELATLLVAAIVFCVIFLLFRRSDDKNLPPSPRRPLPLVGNLLHIPRDSRTQLRKWREQCGDIYSLYMGGTHMVVLNSYDLIKEALVKKADVFSDRPPFFVDMSTGIQADGVVFSNGANWKELRSVSLSILRAFGMGKNLLAEKIEEEADCYVKYLASLKGKPTDIRVKTNISVSNVICSILIGHRFEHDDKEFQNLMHNIESIVLDQQNVGLINFFFWLKDLPGDFFRAKRLTASVQAVLAMLKGFIKHKRRDIDDSNDVCNLIDAYLIERNKKVQAGISTQLTDESLNKIMFELFVAGTETTSTTIYWCVLLILNNPDVQEKVYQEIKENVGTDRTPTMQDKSQLTYLNAVITETQRLASIVPLSVTHMCNEDVTLRGYTIPKGTSIIPNLDSVLHDKATWGEDALSFRPERFIDDNGKLNIPEQFIPFCAGRRVCLGEAIAKMELFLFLSSMFQKFQFLPPTPSSIPPLSYNCGGIVSPKSYQVRMVERA
jgi:cytochrome P450 family 2 subfamily J